MRTSSTRERKSPNEAVVTVDRPMGPPLPPPRLLQPGRTRRPALFLLMILTIGAGAIAAFFLVQNSSQRTAVVGIGHDVAWGQVVTASDLVSVDVVPDPALRTVSWGDRASIIGKSAATDLQVGTLATTRSVMAGGQVPGAGQALVGVQVKAGQLPVTPLTARASVLLVITDSSAAAAVSGGTAPNATSVQAQVFTVGLPDGVGTRTVDVLVPVASAQPVAAAAAADQVSIVLVPRS